MKNNQETSTLVRPYALLKTFSEEELNSFAELIKSNYLTYKKQPYILLKNLRRNALPYSDKFTIEFQLRIFKDMYREEIICNDWRIEEDLKTDKEEKKKIEKEIDRQKKKLNKAMNELRRFAETFMKFEAIKGKDKNKDEYKNYDIELLLPILRKRNQTSLFEKHLKVIDKELNGKVKQGGKYYDYKYQIEAEKTKLLFIKNNLNKKDNYDNLQKYLDTQYLLEKLKYHLAKVTLLKIYTNKKFDFKPIRAVKKLLELPAYKNNPLIQLYLLNIELVEKINDKTYFKLFKALNKNLSAIPSNIAKPFYTNLTNYCSIQIIEGRLNFFKHQFDIYENMHEANLLVSDGFIYPRLLKNVITTSCNAKRFSWAFEILEHYKKFIHIEIRKSVYNYNLGIIKFNQEEYKEALINFRVVSKIDDTHDLGLRVAILKCFYETDTEFEITTQRIIKSFRQYFRSNKKVKINMKKAYLNFIDIFNELYKQKHKKKSNVVPSILEMTLLRDKQWLLDKIKELEIVLPHNI